MCIAWTIVSSNQSIPRSLPLQSGTHLCRLRKAVRQQVLLQLWQGGSYLEGVP